MESGGGSRRPETSAAMSVAAVSVRGPISLSLSLPLPPGDVRRNVRCRCVCSSPDFTLAPGRDVRRNVRCRCVCSTPDCTLSPCPCRPETSAAMSVAAVSVRAPISLSLLSPCPSLPPFLPFSSPSLPAPARDCTLSSLSSRSLPAPSLSFLLPPANAVFCPPLLSPPSI